MLKRIGLLLAMLSLTVLVASPALAQDSLAESLIDRTFSDVFGSPSQSQYDQPPGDDGATPGDDGGTVLPAGAVQGLCGGVVQNSAVPSFIQAEIAESFGLSCEPSGSSFDSFFDGFPF